MVDLRRSIQESIDVKQQLLYPAALECIARIGHTMTSCLRAGKKILVAGNGGSAADAQHFAAELAGRFVVERPGLAAIALTSNTSILTAIGNDYSYDEVFSRQLTAYGEAGDVFVGISTSGNSENIVRAFLMARARHLTTIGLLGKGGGRAAAYCDEVLVIPSDNTQYIQEAHVLTIHLWSAMIDEDWAAQTRGVPIAYGAPVRTP